MGGGIYGFRIPPDLLYWGDARVVMTPRSGRWDSAKIGTGAPPIKTGKGWLLIYHGVRGTASSQIYRLDAALLDLEDPSQVVGRAKEAILYPAAPEDFLGDVGNVVFTDGAILEDERELKIYYGAADQVMCLATANVDGLVGEVARAILEDRGPAISGEDARAVLAIALAAYESSASGKIIALEYG